MESSAIVNSKATIEDKGLPHLATMECRLRCLLIDVTQKDDEDSLKSIVHAAEQLETANARTFINIYGNYTISLSFLLKTWRNVQTVPVWLENSAIFARTDALSSSAMKHPALAVHAIKLAVGQCLEKQAERAEKDPNPLMQSYEEVLPICNANPTAARQALTDL